MELTLIDPQHGNIHVHALTEGTTLSEGSKRWGIYRERIRLSLVMEKEVT
jgi:hypothetical protein